MGYSSATVICIALKEKGNHLVNTLILHPVYTYTINYYIIILPVHHNQLLYNYSTSTSLTSLLTPC